MMIDDHSNAHVRLYEAEVFPSSGQPLEFKNSINEWLMDSSYITLNSEEIAALLYRYDNDPGIRTASHIHNSSVFSGGIVFQKKDGSILQPNAVKWYDSTWSTWCNRLIRQTASLGWSAASFLHHEHYVGVPVVLELHNVTILYKLGTDGFPHFVFLENVGGFGTNSDAVNSFFVKQLMRNKMMTGSIASQASLMYRYIPNVVVYVNHPPSATTGELNSKVSILADDLEMDSLLSDATKRATEGRANPMFVLESVKDRYDADRVVSTIQPMTMLMNSGGSSSSSSTAAASDSSSGMSVGNQQELEKRQSEYSKYLAIAGSGGMDNAYSLAKQHIHALAANGSKEYYVSEGKHYVPHTLPETPGDLLLHFRHARIERVFMIYGIPLSMISQQSAVGGKLSMNENAMLVFENTQKQTKQQLISYMDDMYARIYSKHHELHWLMDTPIGYLNEQLGTREHHGVHIIMPGLPTDETTTQLYMMGCLKYEAFIKFMSAKHSIPVDDFNPTPLVSLDDLNGIKPDDGSSSSSSSSSTSKSKKR